MAEDKIERVYKSLCKDGQTDEKTLALCLRLEKYSKGKIEPFDQEFVGTGERIQNLKPYYSEPQKYQKLLQKHIGGLPPHVQLKILNEEQKRAPFIVIDPKASPVQSHDIVYGYADLYKFLGYPFGEGFIHMKKVGDVHNPFYQPIGPVVPDARTNAIIDEIMAKNPQLKLIAIHDLAKKLSEKYSVKKGISKDKMLEQMKQEMIDYMEQVKNPYIMRMPIKQEELPMYSWRLENFPFVLQEFNKVKSTQQQVDRIKKAYKHIKKDEKKINLSSKATKRVARHL